ncbi:MAG: hypothetical protein VKL42_06890, partial [Snowella sp.]|nr:hypothetical protein [Snowella sp.]
MKKCLNCNNQFESQDWHCPVCDYTSVTTEGNIITFAPDLATESEGFDAGFFPQLAKLEAKNFWFRSRNRLIIYA